MWWYKFKSIFLSWIADIRLYKGGFILFGDSHYKIKGNHMRTILDTLEPGDVLLRRYDHYLGSVTTPGYWSHAAIYVGDNNVIHMLGDGVTKEDILVFMRCDDIAILRTESKETSDSAIIKATEILSKGSEYDYDFNTESDSAFYCTELISYIFDAPRNIPTDDIIMPDHLLDSIWNVVWGGRKS